jgi:hypothetical protein
MTGIVEQLQQCGTHDKNTDAHSVKAKRSASMAILSLVDNDFFAELAERALHSEILSISINENFIGFAFG